MGNAVGARCRVSVIIPLYCESGNLNALINHLVPRGDIDELVIVDASRDQASIDAWKAVWPKLEDASGDLFIVSAVVKGRAVQMNQGAELASGDVLLFLHGDTRLPATDLRRLLAKAETAGWGRFDVCFESSEFWARVVAFMMNLRSRLTGIATGDQAIFIGSRLWQQVGGFAQLPLMEDIEICKRLVRAASPLCLRQTVKTSARRWQNNGVVRTVILMWLLRFFYWLGVSPQRLAQWYRNAR